MSKIVFDKIYDNDMLYDLLEDITDALDETFNKKIKSIPTDIYGSILGTFRVTMEWLPEEEHNEKE